MTATATRAVPPTTPPPAGATVAPDVLRAVARLLVVVPLVAWLVSLTSVRTDDLGGYGLLAALPVGWYAALALTAVGAVAAALSADSRESRWLLATYLLLLVLVLHATPAVLYGLPRYSWTWKHFGVVDYIAVGRDLSRAADIYHNWPGFFTAVQWLSEASGISVTALARWAPPAFQALSTWAVWGLALALTRDRRRSGLAALLYAVTVWVGQDYFAPQALAYVLALVLLSLAARSGTAERRLPLLLVAGLLWLALVTTHQLTPVVVLAAYAPMAVLLRWPGRWWVLPAFGVVLAAWVAAAWPYLSDSSYSLLSLNPFQGSKASWLAAYTPGEGARLRTVATYLLYFGLFATGIGYALRRWRERTELALAAAALGPPVVLLLQDYGGEGQLRTYLFALPFLVLLVARLVLDGVDRLPPRRGAALAAGCVLGLLALFLPSYYGQERINRIVEDDVAASTWFYDNAPDGAELVHLAPNAPTRMTADYVRHPVNADGFPAVVSEGGALPDVTVDEVVAFLRSRPTQAHLLVTRSQAQYLAYFGVLDPAEVERLVAELSADPRLRVVHRLRTAAVVTLAGA